MPSERDLEQTTPEILNWSVILSLQLHNAVKKHKKIQIMASYWNKNLLTNG